LLSVLANAGAGGLSVSEDGGDTLEAGAALYRSDPAVQRFERCDQGLPDTFGGNLDSLGVDALPGGEMAAIGTGAGEAYASEDQGMTWTRLATGLDTIHCVLVLP
jgi:hypothetical protein